MQISSRFTIAIHIFIAIDTFEKNNKITSDFLASSINVNPVVIRRVMQQLKGAGLIEVKRGSGGMSIARDPKEINFLDIFNAVDSIENSQLFHFHENPTQACPVGRNIHRVLDGRLLSIQSAMEEKMKSITLAEVLKDAQTIIENDKDV